MPLPKCSVLWPTNRAEKGIDAAKLTFKLTHYHRIASALPPTAAYRRPVPRRAKALGYTA
jgi:hypothetical protein